MRQAKNNSIMSIMHKIQLKKASIRLQNNKFSFKKNIRIKALIPDDKEEVNFLYGNNLPKDLKRKRSVARTLQASQPSHDSDYLAKLATSF